MSDTGVPDSPKPAKPARKSAPRRRKPAQNVAHAEAAEQAPLATEAAPQGADATNAARRGRKLEGVAAAPQPAVLIRVPMAVRWRDLDAFNHVNNSQYLSYLEEARLQWMLTVPGQGLDDHVAPVVAAANLNYRRPIEWPNEVMIELSVERLGNTSLSIGHRIVARDDASVLFCDGNVVMVWIDRDTGSAAPLPVAVRDACR